VRTRKRLKKKTKLVIIISLIVSLLLAGGLYYYFNMMDRNQGEQHVVVEIPGWDYKLTAGRTDLYRGYFMELKDILLENDPVDYEDYAKKITQLFIADFYDLDNKLASDDIGGLQYILPDARENFILNASNTMYRGIENKRINPGRNQVLPIVTSVNIGDIQETTFMLNDEEVEAFEIQVSWDYEADLGYDSEMTIILVRQGKKLYIVEIKGLES